MHTLRIKKNNSNKVINIFFIFSPLKFIAVKNIRKYVLLFLLFYNSFLVVAQLCNIEETITICDMESIDFDTDGDADGIINLYDEYNKQTGETLEVGTWSVTPRFEIALDVNTGNVSLWDLKFSTTSVNLNDYKFELRNTSCGSDIAATITLILGPYSGVALPPFGINNINVETCDSSPFNLFMALVSDTAIAPAHLNGTWIYKGTSPNFLGITGSEFVAVIPYQPGLPLVDQEVFEFDYVVPGISPCDSSEITTVRISVVRQVNSGIPEITTICENNILSGDFDLDINLEDDQFLRGEDLEGIWLENTDPTGQISNAQDSFINIREIYNDLIDGGNNLRFGCVSYVFEYFVGQSSGVCAESISPVQFNIFEDLRPFEQKDPPIKICANSSEGINLFDLLEFTTEGTTNFIYDNDFYVNWRLVSGPGSLGLVSQPQLLGGFIPGVDYHLGTINAFCAIPGVYTFEYGVVQDINCPQPEQICNPFATPSSPNFTNSTCDILTTLVTIEVLPFDYSGESVSNLEFCENNNSVNLFELLEVDPRKGAINTAGVWTDQSGAEIDNEFIFSEIDADENVVLTYTTTNSTSGCTDTSTIGFTIKNRTFVGSAGESVEVNVCSDNKNLNLFDQLAGSPDNIGTWTGPDGFSTSVHDFEFIFNNVDLPRLKEGVYTYTVGNPDDCVLISEATVTVNFVDPITFDRPITRFFCKKDGNVDLLSVLETTLPSDGVFTDIDATGALEGSVLNVDLVTGGIFNFEYRFDNSPCDSPIRQLVIEIIDDVTPPTAGIGPDEPIRVCSNNLTINLFEQLTGNPSMSGRWNGPFSYESDNFLGEFDKDNIELPILGPGVYTYTVGGRGECGIPTQVQSRVQIEIVDPISIGEDVSASFCKLDGRVNLFTLLDEATTRTGEFIDIDTTNVLDAEGNVEFTTLESGIYNFQYAVTNAAPCDVSILTIEINLVSLPIPVVENPVFCILDAKRINDIPVVIIDNDGNEVDALNLNWYATLDSTQKIEDNPKLFDGDVYFVANGGVDVNDQECESERVPVTIRILNVGESTDDRRVICPLDFQDGISPNGDNQNETFELVRDGEISEGKQFNIPEAFPDFVLQIYNRYGVKVYEGNINTSEFKGQSNQSLSIGNDLVSGVYFYIFNPNFKNNAPIQGSFYLSK